MERILYQDNRHLEKPHWWFSGRRRIVKSLLESLGFDTPRRFLDVGSGAGGMLEVLLPYGSVSALEGDADILTPIRERYGARVSVISSFFEKAELSSQVYDTVTMFDVLEHIEDDAAALRKIYGLLPKDGMFIATVPACPFLWSGHDVLNKHYRRYTKAELRKQVEGAGFKIVRLSYFNFFLFLPIVIARMLFHPFSREDSDFRVPSTGMNSLLLKIFSTERHFLRIGNFPMGVSLFAIAKKEV